MPTLPFNNQVVLITGAGGGIGRELARRLAGKGAIIAATDLKADVLDVFMDELRRNGGNGDWQVADVTDRDAMRRAVAHFEQKLGPIEILIANAGIGIENPAVGFDADAFAKQIAVNLQGVANSVEAVLPGMLKRRRGHLVALSSLASYRGFPRMAGYCASKAGVSALWDALRLELKPHGIACTTICPGWIRTPLIQDILVPKPGLMEVNHAVGVMVRAIERRRAYVAFPWPLAWSLVLNRIVPTWVGDWLALAVLKRSPTP